MKYRSDLPIIAGAMLGVGVVNIFTGGPIGFLTVGIVLTGYMFYKQYTR